MTGRQEYDRTKDRQRTLDKYMINTVVIVRICAVLSAFTFDFQLFELMFV